MLKNKRMYIIPIIGFLIIILIGAILLSLPMSNNKPINFLDSLFLSTSGICVNGFSTINISEQFNFIGQLILACITEIGALGFITFIVLILSIKNTKMKISDTMLVSESINEKKYSNIKRRVKHIFKYTIIIEIIGAILLSIKMIPMYGLSKRHLV